MGEDPPPNIPEELLVPNAPLSGEEEDYDIVADRAAAESIVSGPFPEAGVFKMATLKAFAALFEETEGGGEPPGKVVIFGDQESSHRFDSSRLLKEQLGHIGQGVEFLAPDANEV